MLSIFGRIVELFGSPEWSFIEAHQASTHLSIGLLIGAILFDGGAWIFRKSAWRETALRAQMLGTILLAATFALGYFGNPLVGKSSELAQKADLHFYMGCATLAVFSVLALWRLSWQTRRRDQGKIEVCLYGLLTLIALAIIAVTGWMGGHIME